MIACEKPQEEKVAGSTAGLLTAVILASGVNNIPLYPGYCPGYKALLPFHGKASIEYVLDALEPLPNVRRICIVGHREALEPALHGRTAEHPIIEGGDTLLRSVEIALRTFGEGAPLLFTTGDLPLVTSKAVTDFLAGCAAAKTRYDHNLFVSAVPKKCYTGRYLQFPKTFNQYQDVSLCHGNLALADPAILDVPGVRESLDRMYAARKSPIGSALALGSKIGLTYALGVEVLHTITLRHMARIASAKFGFGIVPVLMEHPEITIDVDEPQDYEFVRQHLDPGGP